MSEKVCPECDSWMWRRIMASTPVGGSIVLYADVTGPRASKLHNWSDSFSLPLVGRVDLETEVDAVAVAWTLGSWHVVSHPKLPRGSVLCTKTKPGVTEFNDPSPSA